MSGSGHPGYSGPGYAGSGGVGGPRRSYEERAAAKDAMMQSLRDSSQQDRRVYVGNLSYDVKWHHLKDFMRQGAFKSSRFHYPLTLSSPLSTIIGICLRQRRDGWFRHQSFDLSLFSVLFSTLSLIIVADSHLTCP